MVSDGANQHDLDKLLFQSALRFAVVSDSSPRLFCRVSLSFQSALRFAVVSDDNEIQQVSTESPFQSALRFAVVSDYKGQLIGQRIKKVSIRFEVRGGFRRALLADQGVLRQFQSALRFAVVSDWFWPCRLSPLPSCFNPL